MSETMDLIDAIASGDYATAKTQFDTQISDRMRDAIDSARIEVASKMYNTESEDDSDEDME